MSTRLPTVLLLLATGLTWSPPASAEEEAPCEIGATADRRREIAREQFGDGQRLAEMHRFDEAMAAYRCSFQNVPHAATMYNIARAAELAGQTRVALDAWRSYLRMSPEADDRAEVEEHVAALEASLAVPSPGPDAAPPPAPVPVMRPVESPFDVPPPPAAVAPAPAPVVPAPQPQPQPVAAAPAPVYPPPPPPAPRRPRSYGRGLRTAGWSTVGVTYGIALITSLAALADDNGEFWYFAIPVAGPAVYAHVGQDDTTILALCWIWTAAEAAGFAMLIAGYVQAILALRDEAQQAPRPGLAVVPGGPGGLPGLTFAGSF